MQRRERAALNEGFVKRLMEKPKHSTINIVVVVNDEDTRWCLRDLLQTNEFRCIACFESAAKALAAIPKLRPDLVAIDIQLFDTKAAEQIGRLKQRLPRLKVIIVTAAQDNESIKRSILARADAYFVKPFMPTQLLGMLKFIAHSQIEVKSAPDAVERACSSGSRLVLTEREEEIMACLAAGLLYKEIADNLGISFSAVHQRQRRIFRKLRVSNRTEAVNKWRELSPMTVP
jgi:DNA-binding NarL/FixJ family response regulator